MTTETSTTRTPRARTARGAHAGAVALLVSTAAVTLLLGGLTALAAAVVADTAAVLGALAGTALAVTVLFGGAVLVDTVASMMPAASLMVALLTYTLQVVVLWVVFSALDSSALLDGTLDRTWLGVTVIVGCLVWITAQLLLAVNARIPAYDLPEGGQA